MGPSGQHGTPSLEDQGIASKTADVLWRELEEQ
jgi:hypothetical protein